MSYALDTNGVARSLHRNHPLQQTAEDAVHILLWHGETLWVLAQNLYEFWVLATRPVELGTLAVPLAWPVYFGAL